MISMHSDPSMICVISMRLRSDPSAPHLADIVVLHARGVPPAAPPHQQAPCRPMNPAQLRQRCACFACARAPSVVEVLAGLDAMTFCRHARTGPDSRTFRPLQAARYTQQAMQ